MAISQFVFAKAHLHFEGNTLPLLIPSLLLVGFMLFLGYFAQDKAASTGKGHFSFGLKTFKDYFQNRSLRMLYITQVCNQTIFWGTIFLLPDVLVTRGYPEDIAYGGGHFSFIIGSVFTMIPSGYLADRFSSRSVILSSGFAGMLFYFSFLLLPVLPSFYLLLILLLAGSLMGVIQPLAVALGNELSKNNPGMVSAFTMGLVWCVSETVGPAGTGLISRLFVEDAPAKALMILGLLFPISLYAAFQLPQSAVEELA
jgi:MFS transporter, FSR family, fosmidomycin resistance protein